jgi:hypothetical protein
LNSKVQLSLEAVLYAPGRVTRVQLRGAAAVKRLLMMMRAPAVLTHYRSSAARCSVTSTVFYRA